MTGFEPATSCSQNRSATKLRYTPPPFFSLPFFFSLGKPPFSSALVKAGDGHLDKTVSRRGSKLERRVES